MLDILIVEDDASLNKGIVLTLKESERQFKQCYDIKTAKNCLEAQAFDLIILDINLPDGSGIDLCRFIRKASCAPILFLTANDTELDIVLGLEVGGDDYITKPFSLAVLRARVSALLRRGNLAGAQTNFIVDHFIFNFENMIFKKSDKIIELSKTEQRLLYLLIQNKGQTLSREKLLERVWQDGTEYVDENALSVAINRLRTKLEESAASPKYIKTIYGIGYTWAVS